MPTQSEILKNLFEVCKIESPAQFARKIAYENSEPPNSNVSKWLNDKLKISLDWAKRISDVFGVEILT